MCASQLKLGSPTAPAGHGAAAAGAHLPDRHLGDQEGHPRAEGRHCPPGKGLALWGCPTRARCAPRGLAVPHTARSAPQDVMREMLQSPQQHYESLCSLLRRIQCNQEASRELSRWGLILSPDIHRVKAGGALWDPPGPRERCRSGPRVVFLADPGTRSALGAGQPAALLLHPRRGRELGQGGGAGGCHLHGELRAGRRRLGTTRLCRGRDGLCLLPPSVPCLCAHRAVSWLRAAPCLLWLCLTAVLS